MSFYYGYIKSDKYKYVFQRKNNRDKIIWVGSIFAETKIFKNERDAAIWIDMVLIRRKKKPINILKPKTN
jgi:hypothetical protein